MRMSKIAIRLYALFLLCFSPCALAVTLAEKLNHLIDSSLPYATVSVLVKDLNKQTTIYSRNTQKMLYPASGTKLFTAAAALLGLPTNYRYHTRLAKAGANYYLSFSGAPDFTQSDLFTLLGELARKSKHKINGDIILDVSQFQSPNYLNGISYDDLGWYFAAPDTAAIIDGNKKIYHFMPAQKLGQRITIIPEVKNNGLTVLNEVVTVTKEQADNHCALNLSLLPNNTVKLYGCMANNKKSRLMKLSVPDPVLQAQQYVAHFIKQNHLVFQGKITTGLMPKTATLIAQHQSAPLVNLLRHLIQESDNVYAKSLVKRLGYHMMHEGNYAQGAYAMKALLAKHTALDFTQLKIVDGVGTRYNMVTTDQIVVLLTEMYHNKKLNADWLSLFPKMGKNGKLSFRMKESALKEVVLAKTGTLHDVSSLSGYLLRSQKAPIVFSIIINGINVPVDYAKTLENKILLMLNDNT